MKGRENRGAQPADLLVCFPSRAHVTLMPKPLCSPARPSEPNTYHRSSRRRPHHHLKKSGTRRGSSSSNGGGQGGSPLFWAKGKQMGSGGAEIAEPTSPKVTCAGQIKVRHRSSACRNWQSVMEEIERIHNNGKQRKKPNWAESLGFKKEITHFLTCLRTIRFNFRCFGSVSAAVISSDEEAEEEEEEAEDETCNGNHQPGIEGSEENGGSSRTVFSKWFMVLDEGQNGERKKLEERESCFNGHHDDGLDDEASLPPPLPPPPPPPNALLLMRCRSAPAKSWLEEREKEREEKLEEKEKVKEEERGKKVEEVRKEKKNGSLAIVMKCDTDFHRLSTDIGKEAWVVGGLKDPLSRSRSWKR
ncbi:hypothetical protein Ancab_038464 [Ancistrocladus abbreviatus]